MRPRPIAVLASLLLLACDAQRSTGAQPATSPPPPTPVTARPAPPATASGPPRVSLATLIPPLPANLYQNSSFAVAGDVLYLPSDDADVLWTFSLASGQRLDPDGLALPGPGLASNPTVLAGNLVAIAGWFPEQGVAIVDASDPTALRLHGVVRVPATASVQGMQVLTFDGTVGWVASFADRRLYGFDPRSLALLDPTGTPLPGNPDRATTALAPSGPRLVIVDTEGGTVMVVDVTDPRQPRVAGSITLPGAPAFASANQPTVAADGHTGFVVSQQRTLYSFDLEILAPLDADGLPFGDEGAGLSVVVADGPAGRRVAALGQRGVALVDATEASNLRRLAYADLGGDALLQGDASAAFSADTSLLAFPVIRPRMALAIVEASSGRPRGGPIPLGEQPNFLARLGPDTLGVLCSGAPDAVWVVEGAFAAATAAAPPTPAAPAVATP